MKSLPAPLLAALSLLLLTAAFSPRAAFAQQEQQPAASEQRTAAPEPSSATPPSSVPEPQAPPMTESDRLPFMQDSQSQVSDEAPGSFGLLLRTVGALLLIVGLVFGAAWGLKRYGGTRFGAAPQADAPPLAVLSTMSLGDRRSLAVVKFGERTLLVGSTPQNITLLAEEEGDVAQEEPMPAARSVADMLKQNPAGDPFARELSDAEHRAELIPGGWHALDREGAA